MKIFGKTLSEYVKFDRVFLILVLAVGIARLGASLAGVPNATVKFLSLTVVFLLAMLYYSITVHTSGFGSYKQLLPVLALPVILGNCVIIVGIAISMATGKDNIFSAPEYSPNKASGRTLGHIGGHVVATIVLPLIMWALGSLIMFITKKVTGSREASGSTAGA